MGAAARRHRSGGSARSRRALFLAAAAAAAVAAAAVVAASAAAAGGAASAAAGTPTADGFSDENDGALADFAAIKEATSTAWGGGGGSGVAGDAPAAVGVADRVGAAAGRPGVGGVRGGGTGGGGGGGGSRRIDLPRHSVEAIRSVVAAGGGGGGGGGDGRRGRVGARGGGGRRPAYPAKAMVAAAMGGSRAQRRSRGTRGVALRPVLLRARVAPGQPLPAAEGGPAEAGPAAAAAKAAGRAGSTLPAAAVRTTARTSVGRGVDEYVAMPGKFWGQAHYEHERKAGTGETLVRLVGQPDEFVYDTFFKHPPRRGGVFVELGAVDGVKYSNTRFFEDTLDWSGLLIEGSKENFLSMYHNRPRSAKAWSAVCDAVGTKLFVGDGAAAGAVDTLTEKHLLSFGKFFKSMDPYDVPCEPLRDVLARSGVTHIDLFSLDISGSEAVALRTFDWDAVSVDVLVLYPGASCTEGGMNVCEAALVKAGMCRAAKLAVNEYWVGSRALKARHCVDAAKPTPPPVAAKAATKKEDD